MNIIFISNLGLIWSEIKQLWELGLVEYVADMWNIIDFVTNSLYVATIALRIVVYFQVRNFRRNVIELNNNNTFCNGKFIKKKNEKAFMKFYKYIHIFYSLETGLFNLK